MEALKPCLRKLGLVVNIEPQGLDTGRNIDFCIQDASWQFISVTENLYVDDAIDSFALYVLGFSLLQYCVNWMVAK